MIHLCTELISPWQRRRRLKAPPENWNEALGKKEEKKNFNFTWQRSKEMKKEKREEIDIILITDSFCVFFHWRPIFFL
jgi:hypothetical protein